MEIFAETTMQQSSDFDKNDEQFLVALRQNDVPTIQKMLDDGRFILCVQCLPVINSHTTNSATVTWYTELCKAFKQRHSHWIYNCSVRKYVEEFINTSVYWHRFKQVIIIILILFYGEDVMGSNGEWIAHFIPSG